jgi:signal transduction histidine kinase
MCANVALALASALSVLAFSASAWAEPAPTRVVLTIHLGAETFPSNPILDEGIRKALESRGVPIDYFAEYYESDLFPGEDASLAFADYLQRKYRGRRIDVVIASTGEVLQFVLNHRGELFPNVPVVYVGATAPDESTLKTGVTGIRVAVAYADTLRFALDLQPSTARVFVVANGAVEQTRDAVRATLGELSDRVSIEYLDGDTVATLLSAVKAVPQGSVILYIWHQALAERGNVMYSDEVARLVAQVAPVPVYGTSDLYLGTGVVGGVVRRTGETGWRLGEMALRILTGTRPVDMPVEDAPVAPAVDWRQVERWHLAARLPAGTQILFRDPSAWETYRVYFVVATVALLMQAALITLLLIQRARRRTAEQQLRHSQSALRKSFDQVRDLGSRLLDAQERERSRIARELHDDVNQQLAALRINLAMLGRTLEGRAQFLAEGAAKRVGEITRSVRSLSHRLHPARLQLMGLVEALEELQSEASGPNVTVTFTHQNVPPSLPPELTVSLFRVAQEALQNALRYSQARTVSVDLRSLSGDIALTITDDGVGFDVEAMWGKGLGLISMRERVEALGGTADIHSHPGAGTVLAVNIPASALRNSEAVAV